MLGALLRFATLGEQSWSGDEGVTVALVRASFGDMLDAIPRSESTPPVYYALAWLWTRALGSSEEWGLRSLSALAGTAAIPAAYAAASALVTRRAGLVAAALVACSPLLVWYSQESRAYALATLLIALTLWLFARRALVPWAVVAALAVATHYFAAFVVVPEAVWLVAGAAGPAARRSALAACAAVALVGAALLPLALEQRSTGNTAYIAEIAFDHRAKEIPKKFAVGEQASPGDYGALIEALKWPAIALALLGVALLAARGDERERRGGIAAAAIAATGFAIALVLKAAGLDYVAAYNLQVLWLPVAIVVAAGFGARRAGAAGLAATAAACAVAVAVVVKIAADSHLQRYDYRAVARQLREPPRARAIVVNPLNSTAPLAAYEPGIELLPQRTRVTEIAIVALRSQDESTRARAFDPRYAPRVPGFRQTQRIDAGAYTLLRLTAPRPRPVDPADLQRARLGATDAALLGER